MVGAGIEHGGLVIVGRQGVEPFGEGARRATRRGELDDAVPLTAPTRGDSKPRGPFRQGDLVPEHGVDAGVTQSGLDREQR